jgi:CDP-glucose 4,6-dehydratase
MVAHNGSHFWQDKRVFLSGHTGFKGTWLAWWLLNHGARVFGISLAPENSPNLGELAGIERRVISVRQDIRDREGVARAMIRSAPDIVFHLAAQSLVHRSYAEPVLTYETNVMGTVNLLEAVRRTPSTRAVVIVTSDKCYENRESRWAYNEHDHLGGYDPYSSSKACAELIAAAWRRSFLSGTEDGRQVAIATARAGNVIGGGDWAPDRLIPDCVRAFCAGRPVLVRSPNATRPWQHVLEPLSGYLLLAERLWYEGSEMAEAWNFGPPASEVKPVVHVVRQMVDLWGDHSSYQILESSRSHEAGQLILDSTKAMKRLGWRPRIGLEEALVWTAHWYKQQHLGGSAEKLLDEQIARFDAITVNASCTQASAASAILS